MDPKIQERRIEILRAKGRRRLRVVLLVASLILLAIGGVAITKSSLLDVDEIVIKGADKELETVIRNQTSSLISEPLLEVNGRSAIKRIEKIPKVKTAKISKSFNGTLTIHITTRTPVIAMNDQGSWILLDDEGRALKRMLELPHGYLVIAGVADVPKVGEWAFEQVLPVIDLALNLPAILAVDISTIEIGDTVDLLLYGEGKVLFGDANNIDAKVLAAATILRQADLDNLVHIDVRAPKNPVLCRSKECSYAS